MNHALFFLIAAICIFVIVAVLCFFATAISTLTILGLICVGLAVFVAAHLPV